MEFTLIVKVPCISVAILILSLFRPTSCKRTDPEYQLDCHTKCLMLKSKRVSTHEIKTSYMDDCVRRCIDRQTEEGEQHQRTRRSNNGALHCYSFASNGTDYAGIARNLDVTCREPGKSVKRGFVIRWDQPKDYLNASYEHFEIMYSVKRENHVATSDVTCHAVGKNTLSYVVENVSKTDEIVVVVLAYPYPDVFSNEKFKAFKPCSPTTSSKTVPPGNSSPVATGAVHVEVAVGSSIAVVVALAMLALVVVYHRRRKRQNYPDLGPQEPVQHGKVYVSYYPDSATYHSRLIQLVAKFRREYSLDLIMDSYCETGVAELGIARWCQMQLSESTRVLMVMSREYLEICREWQSGLRHVVEADDGNVNRVCSELQYVVDHMFESRRNLLVTIVLDGVSRGDLPAPFRGMKSYIWPTNVDEEHALVSDILSQEAIQALN